MLHTKFPSYLSCLLVRLQKSSTNEPSLKICFTEYIRKYTNFIRNFVIKIGHENIVAVQNILTFRHRASPI